MPFAMHPVADLCVSQNTLERPFVTMPKPKPAFLLDGGEMRPIGIGIDWPRKPQQKFALKLREIEEACARALRETISCREDQRVQVHACRGAKPNWDVCGFAPHLDTVDLLAAVIVIADLQESIELQE